MGDERRVCLSGYPVTTCVNCAVSAVLEMLHRQRKLYPYQIRIRRHSRRIGYQLPHELIRSQVSLGFRSLLALSAWWWRDFMLSHRNCTFTVLSRR
eukprot:1150750-Pelagomonas_calceolata.AAC.1